MIEIVRTGPLVTVQDLGRDGWAHLGVGRSGAADRAALALGNRLVGNPPGAAGLESTLGGLEIVLRDAATVALTGAPCPGLDRGRAVTLPAGARVALGTPPTGLRSYLTVRGGIDVPVELGSRSTDTLGGLGTPVLRTGDVLPVGRGQGTVSDAVVPDRVQRHVLRVVPGPRDDWFDIGAFTGPAWVVRPDSDRVGMRLHGPPLARRYDMELPSEPTLPGALQVPHDGQPILLGPDAPVTGGYPVIAVVRDADLDDAFQIRPGEEVRFTT